MHLKHRALEQEQNRIWTNMNSRLVGGENGESQSLLVNIQTWMFTKVFGMFMLVPSLQGPSGAERRMIHFEVILSTQFSKYSLGCHFGRYCERIFNLTWFLKGHSSHHFQGSSSKPLRPEDAGLMSKQLRIPTETMLPDAFSADFSSHNERSGSHGGGTSADSSHSMKYRTDGRNLGSWNHIFPRFFSSLVVKPDFFHQQYSLVNDDFLSNAWLVVILLIIMGYILSLTQRVKVHRDMITGIGDLESQKVLLWTYEWFTLERLYFKAPSFERITKYNY